MKDASRQTLPTATEDAPPTCVGCGARSRLTDSYALIRDGWRLTRPMGADGSLRSEWRCTSCWSSHKKSGSRITPAPKRGE